MSCEVSIENRLEKNMSGNILWGIFAYIFLLYRKMCSTEQKHFVGIYTCLLCSKKISGLLHRDLTKY